MPKQIFSTKEEKEPFYKGISQAASIIGSTMGLEGKNVVINRSLNTMPDATKDGVTVCVNLYFKDRIENSGANFVKAACKKTVDEAGDGTTNTAVLMNAIITEGRKAIENGARPQLVKKGIDLAVQVVVANLKQNSEPVGDDYKKLLDVATISANNDSVLGKIIADAYHKAGKTALILPKLSGTGETYADIVDGFEFNGSYFRKEFINTPKGECVFDNPLILLYEYDLTDIKKVLEGIKKMFDENIGRPFVIIAKDFGGNVLGTMIENNVHQRIKVCLIKLPSLYQDEHFDDIATITGATVMRADSGKRIESMKESFAGGCERIIITDKKTTIITGKGDATKVLERVTELNLKIGEAEGDKPLKEQREKRLAQLTGKSGIIYVGAKTDVEAKEKIDRVDDALRAVKSAIEEGVSIGGGIALLRCMHNNKLFVESFYEKDTMKGIEIVTKILESPIRQMLKNGNIDGHDKIFDNFIYKLFPFLKNKYVINQIFEAKNNYGYNFKTGKIEDLKKSGVIDPTKVIRVALENAASIAGIILTTGDLLIEMEN